MTLHPCTFKTQNLHYLNPSSLYKDTNFSKSVCIKCYLIMYLCGDLYGPSLVLKFNLNPLNLKKYFGININHMDIILDSEDLEERFNS